MYYVALKELCQVWENKPDHVIGVISAWTWRVQICNRKSDLQTGGLEFEIYEHLAGIKKIRGIQCYLTNIGTKTLLNQFWLIFTCLLQTPIIDSVVLNQSPCFGCEGFPVFSRDSSVVRAFHHDYEWPPGSPLVPSFPPSSLLSPVSCWGAVKLSVLWVALFFLQLSANVKRWSFWNVFRAIKWVHIRCFLMAEMY